jgi:2-dehydro-3-deoxyphosphooctonate aldolase (KDO 8-P synthase)
MRIIAGPCQHESLEHSMMIAEHCARACAKYPNIEYYYKASYDKANRSSMQGKRGVGLAQTMQDFESMKKEIPGLRILTDVHTRGQIDAMGAYPDAVDVLQIPAFLCRQTDLIQRACETGMPINIKKGQFLAPWDVAGILSKCEDANEVWITERGTSFGYNTLVVDFTGIDYMLNTYSVPIVLDATHSVQKPGGNGTSSGGNRSYVPGLCRAASALGVSNFFLEVHQDPDNAPSDGPNMLHLQDFEKVIDDIVAIRKAVE